MQECIEPPVYPLKEETYRGGYHYFYNSTNFPAIVELEKNWKTIRDEVLGSITDEELSNMQNLNPPYLSSPDAWKNIYFSNFGWMTHINCKRFSKTWSLLQKIPDMVFAGITVLEPNSRVLPHCGESNVNIRCHLGLKIPATLPDCGIRVGEEEQSWQEGKVTMFTDAHYHQTWNLTNERRFVLVFDIIRPEYSIHQHSISAKMLGVLSVLFIYGYAPWFKQLPYFILRPIHFCFSFFWYCYLPLQQKIKWLP